MCILIFAFTNCFFLFYCSVLIAILVLVACIFLVLVFLCVYCFCYKYRCIKCPCCLQYKLKKQKTSDEDIDNVGTISLDDMSLSIQPATLIEIAPADSTTEEETAIQFRSRKSLQERMKEVRLRKEQAKEEESEEDELWAQLSQLSQK